jgi:DNA-directed RNA polymerase alpha subunit
MSLLINSEKSEIALQMSIVEKFRSKMSFSVRHHKEINHVQILFKLIEKHMLELETLGRPSEDRYDIALYLEANTRIKNHIAKKGQQAKQLITDFRYEIDANQTIECFAKIT